jgi:hypothetical protein
MRRWSLLALVLATGCPGPTPAQVAETPSARAPRRPAEAPGGGPADRDRNRAIEQMEDMETAQRAREEASQGGKPVEKPKPKKPAPKPKAPPAKSGSATK